MPSRKRTTLYEFKRYPSLQEVSFDDIKRDPSHVSDDHFVKLYVQYRSGINRSTLTRIDISRIYSGVFWRDSDGTIHRSDYESGQKHIEWMCYDIRRGYRPPLHLYRGFFGESAAGFVCSDDVLAYNAYRALGIRLVPAKILGRQKNELDESGICLRVINDREVFDSSTAVARTHAQTLLGLNYKLKELSALEAIQRLESAARNAAACVKAFHIEIKSKNKVRYHHSLHSVAYRLSEILRAAALLLEHDLTHQIRPLVRSAYELLLNFYIDWLAPEHMGLLLQGLAVLSRIGKSHPGYKKFQETIRRSYGGLSELCRNAAEKGRLSPLGDSMHADIYGALSPVVHQDFGVTHEYSDTLESGSPSKMDNQELTGHIRVLDLVTAAMVSRITDDVGAPDGRPQEWPKIRRSKIRRVGLRTSKEEN
jgi:hypothetical protein